MQVRRLRTARAGPLLPKRSSRTGRLSSGAPVGLEETAEDRIGDRHTARRLATGGRDGRVSRSGLGGDRLDPRLAQLPLHGAALVRKSEGDDGSGLPGPGGAAGPVEI